MKQNNTALITGGAGFIGSHVARHLIDCGMKAIILDDLSGGFVENLPEGGLFFEGSINDEELLDKIFEQHKIDYIFHLAAYAAEGLSHFIRQFNYTNNLLGSINLINRAVNHKVKCFVFTSSIAVYGENQLPMLEETQPKPEDPYGIAKYAVELDLKAAHEMFGLDYIIFRPHNVYGEHQNIGDRYRNVIGIFINQIMNDKPLTIFGDGEQTRAFSYIDDVAPVIANSIFSRKAYNQIFNVGANQPYSVNQLAQIVRKVMKSEQVIEYLPARKEVVDAYSTHDKVHSVFGQSSDVSLEDGVEAMVRWALKEGSKQSVEFTNIEIEKKLPPSWAIKKSD
jgi:UDP-glucose 4-epimerase